jgi:hypothetical protein
LINDRDETIRQNFIADVYRDSLIKFYFALDSLLSLQITTLDDATQDRYNKDYHAFFNVATTKFSSLDSGFQTLVLSIIDKMAAGGGVPFAGKLKDMLQKGPYFNLKTLADSAYNAHKTYFQNKSLLTIGISDTSYSDAVFSKNVQTTAEYLKGLLNPKKSYNLQLDIKALVNFTDDTLQAGRNLHREVFTFTPGINYVLNGKTSHMPWLEFEVSGSYSNVWKGHLYKGEDQIVNTINGTLRVLITDNIWIPVTITYNPKNGNVLGLLNVTTNFTGLGNLFKGNSKKS